MADFNSLLARLFFRLIKTRSRFQRFIWPFDCWQNDNFDFEAYGWLCQLFAFLFRPLIFSAWPVFSYQKFYK